jgi:hypothetical protein
MAITTKDAADMLAGVAAAKRNAAVVPPGGADADYRRKATLGRSGEPFVEGTQDERSNTASGGRSQRTT